MKKRQMRGIARGLAGSIALVAVNPAWAGTVNIEMPQKGEAVGGANIACVAQFKSSDRPITHVDFVVDDQKLVSKAYQEGTPEARVTFVWDATGVPAGPHVLSVRAFAGPIQVGTDEIPVVVSADGDDIVRPQVHVYFPKPNSVVAGEQDVAIHASDNVGVTMVSLFIDKQLKLLQNVPPYHYSWDTSQYTNGPHTLEVWAFDGAQNKGAARPVRVFVNNPTGRTEAKDIPDEAPVKAAARTLAIAKKPLKTPAAATAPAIPVTKTSTNAKTLAPVTKMVRVAELPPKPKTVTPAVATSVTVPIPTVIQPVSKPKVARQTPSVPAEKVSSASQRVREPASVTAIPEVSAKKPAAPKAMLAMAPKPAFPVAAHHSHLILPKHTAPTASRPALAMKENPVLMAKLPPAPPLAEGIGPALRSSLPSAEKATPAAVAAPPVKATITSKPVTRTPKVRVARVDTRPSASLGHAHSEDLMVQSSSPAAHRTMITHAPLRLMLGQQPISFDVQPVIRGGMAIAPIRQIIEHMGGVVMWFPMDRTVQAKTGSQSIELKIGSRQAKVNDEVLTMDRPARIQSGRTVVPVRFLQVALDMKVLYDPSKGLVMLYHE